MGCDAIAHHPQWGSADLNIKVESNLEFVILSILNISNVGNRVRDAVLDIMFS